MNPSNFARLGGALASVAGGVLLLLGHLFNVGGDPEYGTVLGSISVLIAHLLLVFALVALYAAQAESSGVLGGAGMVLAVVGTILVCGVVLVEVAGASGQEVEGLLSSGVSGVISVVAVLTFFFGLILFGAATMRAGVFARWAGVLLIAGELVFAAGGFFGAASSWVYVLGAAITGAALVWLGLSLAAASAVGAQRRARVS